MFGGVCFMLNGNMLAGTFRDETLFRVGKDADAVALKRAHTRPMEQAGRRAVGYVLVSAEGTRRDRDLNDWLALAIAYVETLPSEGKETSRSCQRIAQMNVLLATLAYVIPTFPLGYVWHLNTFKDRYSALRIYRDDCHPAAGTRLHDRSGRLLRADIRLGHPAHGSGLASEGRDLRSARWPSIVELHHRGRGREDAYDFAARVFRAGNGLHWHPVDHSRRGDSFACRVKIRLRTPPANPWRRSGCRR